MFLTITWHHFYQHLRHRSNIDQPNVQLLSTLECQDIYIGTQHLPAGAGPWIRIKSRRSTIQNWRLKIEHVQRIKVDRDSSPNQVARRTLEHWAIWYLAMVDLVMLLGQLSPNLPACSQFTGLPACRRNAPTFKAEYSTRKFFPTLDLSHRKFQPRQYSIVQFFVLGICFCWNFFKCYCFNGRNSSVDIRWPNWCLHKYSGPECTTWYLAYFVFDFGFDIDAGKTDSKDNKCFGFPQPRPFHNDQVLMTLPKRRPSQSWSDK